MNGRPDLTEQLQRLHRIGIALSSERSLDRLLEMIVEEARRLTGADGGTLYLVSGDSLEFRIVQTGTLGVRMGGPSGAPIAWPPVPLKVDGRPNEAHVCAWAAVHGRTANIPDVYEAEGYDFRGTRAFDAASGYRSRSMLVVPMRDHVSVTMRLLDQIPFPNKLKGVPRCAGGHHEKLNGKGYPPGPDGRRFAPADADAGHCRRVRSAHRRRPLVQKAPHPRRGGAHSPLYGAGRRAGRRPGGAVRPVRRLEGRK